MRSPWLSSYYRKLDKVHTFALTVDGHKFHILLNPEIGSWVALIPDEFEAYQNGTLDELKWESLYMRKLASTADGGQVELAFPGPANYPSVVVVNITTNCNLRCKYCFADCEPFKGEDMTEEVMVTIIQQMLEMPEVGVITFEFQGGEPTTNIPGLRRFIEHAERLKASSGKAVKYRIETNGILITDDLIALIKRFDIEVGVSIDGPKLLNDAARIYPDGTGTFQDIEQGIRKLRANGITIDGSCCTMGQHNVGNPIEIVEFFNQIDISFKPRPANVLGREIISKMTTKPGEWAEAYKKMYHVSKQGRVDNFSIHIFEENVYTPIRDYICLRFPCGAAREIISINPNGDVVPCDGFKGEQAFVMGNVLEESIVDMLQKDWVVKLRNRTWEDIPKCKECMFHAMCCSCCYSAYGAFGTIWREDPHCIDRRKIFVFLMKEWIRENVLCNGDTSQAIGSSGKPRIPQMDQ